MPQKVYYHATSVTTFEWVDSPDKASQVDKQSAEGTQKQLKDTEHMDTELREIPAKAHHLPSMWVISRDEIGKDGGQGESPAPESAEEPDRSHHGKTMGPVIARRRGGRPARNGSGKKGSKNPGGSSSGGRKRRKKNAYKKSGRK